MSRDELVAFAHEGLAHRAAGTQTLFDGVLEVPIEHYIGTDRWQLEVDRVFKRLPLVAGYSADLREPHAYLSIEIAGTPVLLTRGEDGAVRAFVNMCSHRGAIVAEEGSGVARRHVCPYHAWTYDSTGALVGVLDAEDFGALDRSCLGLTSLPAFERAGIIWVSLAREPAIDFDTFISGYDDMLVHLDLANCHVVGRQVLDGPNWKIAYDGYLDYYHLPILHRATFGPDTSTRAWRRWWGPHQHQSGPDRHTANPDVADTDWRIDELIGGVWTIFPHVSIAAFDSLGKVWMISQLFPGATPLSSRTIQTFLHTKEPDDAIREIMVERMDFNRYVVAEEDYRTGLGIQKAMKTGAKKVNLFGRNEGGSQRFHTLLDQLIATDDADLALLFKAEGADEPGLSERTDMMTEVQTICRFCHSFCGITVTVDDGVPVKVVGDVDNPMYEGYSCIKGRSLPEQHRNPERLLHSQKRTDDGIVPIAVEQAMDEIAARLADIVAEHGPRAVALYTGTFSFMYPTGGDMAKGFMAALGSPMRFSSGAIDQPGKGISRALHGTWSAGPQPFDQADTWMLVGANPVVSMWGGIPQYNPAKRLREAKARGMKLIVIDPRRTECARVADLHLQCRPGEDPTILAGILRVILTEGLHDAAFVASETQGFDDLQAGVEPFTPAYVEARADVPAEQLVQAARMFATGTAGSVTAGTGPNMAPRGTLAEYLIACIQTVCGRWLREGEPVPNPFVLLPAKVAKAQADPKIASHGYGEQLRVKGLTDTAAGMPTAALADEILMPGEGRVRALICLGGNPVAAWPDQLKAIEAIEALELAVTLDIKMSATAKMCDYVIAPKLSLEAPSTTMPNEGIWGYGAATTGYPEPYAQFAPVVVDPPEGADVIEEWEFFYGLAQRLGLSLRFAGVELDMTTKPSSMDLLRHQTRRGRIPLDDVMAKPHGAMFPDPEATVLPKDDGWTERLDIGHPLMTAELAEVAGEPLTDHGGYTADERFSHRLISRRLHEVYNSSGRDIERLIRRYPYNPAFMHPDDLADCGFATGDVIEIDSGHASILGVVEAADDVKYGCISMAHSFGDTPKHDGDVRLIGSNTGRLSDFDATADPITGLPWMSAIPVNVRLSDESFATV